MESVDVNHVHEELSAIAASLREKQRSLAAREAELNKREANVTRDEEFIQKLQEKEAVTVGLLEKEVHRGAEVDAENKAHIEQLESTCDQLRARCAALAGCATCASFTTGIATRPSFSTSIAARASLASRAGTSALPSSAAVRIG